MKKRFLLILAFVLAFTVACSNDTEEVKTEEAETKVQEEEPEEDEEVEEEEEAEEEEEIAEDDSTFGGTFTQEFDLSNHDSEELVRLWIPCAQTNEFQEITNVEISTEDGDPVEYEINEDDLGNEMIYVEWTPEETNRKLTYSFDLTREEIIKQDFGPEEEIDPEEFKEYLGEATLVPIDGEVEELAKELTADKDTVEEKSRAIYQWIFENMVRNDDVTGCGPGDVIASLTSLDGKCTDINSVYIGLARSAGIPAREIFGVRLSEDNPADLTKSQHCWTEYYQPGTGWVVTDVADVLRACLYEELDKESEEAKEVYDYYYGNLDPIRVAFSTGRDLTLNPEANQAPINQFGYPYAEVDGEALDFYSPDEFIYEFTFEPGE